MKKLLLLSISVVLLSCTEIHRVSVENGIEYTKSNYSIEQSYFSGEHKTYVWYKGNIVESWSIEPKDVTKEAIKRDSIKANNLIVKLEIAKP